MVSGNRDVRYTYGKNGEVLGVEDRVQGLGVRYEYDGMGRETARIYGNGVREEREYDGAGRVVVIRELDGRKELLRGEGYLYDGKGRRSHKVDEKGLVTEYIYDGQSRVMEVMYPWTAEKRERDRREAEEAGVHFGVGMGVGESYSFGSDAYGRVRALMNRMGPGRGSLVGYNQVIWRERYEYDRNGNRVSKRTPWGTVTYEYDEENRLVRKGTIRYGYDGDGNLISEEGEYRRGLYGYNGMDRMESAEVTDVASGEVVISWYGYDGYGRRTVRGEAGRGEMRTVYDGLSFEVVREGET
jgi:YD repeat-containing protein